MLLVPLDSQRVLFDLASASALTQDHGDDDRSRPKSETRAVQKNRRQNARLDDSLVFFFFTFVLHAPLQLDDDHLSRQLIQERLRVDGHGGLCVGGDSMVLRRQRERERDLVMRNSAKQASGRESITTLCLP